MLCLPIYVMACLLKIASDHEYVLWCVSIASSFGVIALGERTAMTANLTNDGEGIISFKKKNEWLTENIILSFSKADCCKLLILPFFHYE